MRESLDSIRKLFLEQRASDPGLGPHHHLFFLGVSHSLRNLGTASGDLPQKITQWNPFQTSKKPLPTLVLLRVLHSLHLSAPDINSSTPAEFNMPAPDPSASQGLGPAAPRFYGWNLRGMLQVNTLKVWVLRVVTLGVTHSSGHGLLSSSPHLSKHSAAPCVRISMVCIHGTSHRQKVIGIVLSEKKYKIKKLYLNQN